MSKESITAWDQSIYHQPLKLISIIITGQTFFPDFLLVRFIEKVCKSVWLWGEGVREEKSADEMLPFGHLCVYRIFHLIYGGSLKKYEKAKIL